MEFEANGDNQIANFDQPRLIALEPHRNGPASPGEANKVLHKVRKSVKVPTYTNFLCTSYN